MVCIESPPSRDVRPTLLLAATIETDPPLRVCLEHPDDAARLANLTRCRVRIDGLVRLGQVFAFPIVYEPESEAPVFRVTAHSVLSCLQAHEGKALRANEVCQGLGLPADRKPAVASALYRLVVAGEVVRPCKGTYRFLPAAGDGAASSCAKGL